MARPEVIQTSADRDDALVGKIADAVADATMKVHERLNPLRENARPFTGRWNETEGKARPVLKHRTFFCGSPQDPRQLKDEEIELYNQLKPGRYHSRKWEVIQRQDGDESLLEVRLPIASKDDLYELPNSLVAILSEIVKEQEAAGK